MTRVLTFKGASFEDVVLIGKKAHVLCSLFNSGQPVPKGFVITTNAYYDFLSQTGLKAKLSNLISCLETDQDAKVEDISKQIQKHIIEQELPEDLKEEIVDLYSSAFISSTDTQNLIQYEGEPHVAIRISYLKERKDVFFDYSPHFLNVQGKEKLIRIVKTCWASIFDTDAIIHREKNDIDHMSISIAIIVQEMVNPKASGIVYTVDLNKNDSMLIEAIKGFSDPLIKGEITGDTFAVLRNTRELGPSKSNEQSWGYFLKENKLIRQDIPTEERHMTALDNISVERLAEMAVKVENYFEWPQKIEFIVDDNIYIIESNTLDIGDYEPIVEPEKEPEVKPEIDMVDVDEAEDYEDYAKPPLEKDDVFVEYYDEEKIEKEKKESLFDDFKDVPEYDSLRTEIIDVFRKYKVINPNIKEALDLLKNDILKILDER